jgi:quercetin dioxygenase-like cupin family protein
MKAKLSPSRVKVLVSIVLLWAVSAFWSGPSSAQQTSTLFTGGTPSRGDIGNITTTRLRFPKGSRSNWHSHVSGQLLMVEEGLGRTQERGKPLREMAPGNPWWTAAGVEHWHGAAPDQDMLQLTIYGGEVKWLEPVSDKEYLAPPSK